MKNTKGVTLISLIITIIVLLILATVATYSGLDIIQSSQLTEFSTEMKILQTQVNSIYDKYTSNQTINIEGVSYTGEQILNIEDKVTDEITSKKNQIFQELSNEPDAGIYIDEKEQYAYWSNNIIQKLGIEGVKRSYFVNLKRRSIVSSEGLKYEGKMYYTLNQLPDNLYNVEYNDPNMGKPSFNVTVDEKSKNKWQIDISNIQYSDGYIEKWQVKYKFESDDYWSTSEDLSFFVNKEGTYTVKIFNGEIISEDKEIIVEQKLWEATTKEDKGWYSYDKAKIMEPKLLGEMVPIKYVGDTIEEKQNKWANATTKDGSMFVWIPRYAYRITKGYHSNTTGTIEVAFIDKDNNFLNGDGQGLEITDKPSEITYTAEGVQEQWLVHPAFTNDASIGGGFGEAGKGIDGFWIGKFESTGSSTKLSVKPGEKSLVNMQINQQFKLAKSSTFGESVTAEVLGSHMVKNSEWGAVVYLAHSKYGAKNEEGESGQEIQKNSNSNVYTGGSENKIEIYTTNKKQSTTYNATGVYDMSGGGIETVAAYVNNQNEILTIRGGQNVGDLYGTEAERNISTKYKTVYLQGSQDGRNENYEANKGMKGDALYETSYSGGWYKCAWFSNDSFFPDGATPFFIRGGDGSAEEGMGAFCFGNWER